MENQEFKSELNTTEQTTSSCSTTGKKKCSPCAMVMSVISILSFIGVIILSYMVFCPSAKQEEAPKQQIAAAQTGSLRIAYVNTDSIMVKYNYAKELEQNLKDYQVTLENRAKAKVQQFQADYQDFLQNGDKLTLTQQKQREEELTRRGQEMQMLEQNLMQELSIRQIEDNKKLLDAVYAFIADYNRKNQNYNIILSRSYVSSGILYADDSFDMTQEIIDGLNKEYKEVSGK